MEKQIKITNNYRAAQYLKYSDQTVRGGKLVLPGDNYIDLDEWEKLKNSPWTKRLMQSNTIVVGKEIKQKKKSQTKKESIKELQDEMEKTNNKTIKTKIAKKIQKINDGE